MRVVVVASGETADGDAAWLEDAELVIAADGGATWLASLGRTPDRIVGDLDSVDSITVQRLATDGSAVERHPRDKEASDTELAVEAARRAGATSIVLLGGFGGERLDHEIANLLLLAEPAIADLDVRAIRGPTIARAVHGGRGACAIGAAAGDVISLLPLGGDAVGVSTEGLHWPLERATLAVGRSRGLSNVVDQVPASVSLESGVLLVIQTSTQGATAS
jgi:thiamine pyrophosphokinase